MTKIVTTQVGPDGVLNLHIPLGEGDANKRVRVVVETLDQAEPSSTPMTEAEREEWLRFIERTAGAITDPTFIRHPQGEYEERDWWP
jgi:hypothetical protein